jgi:putative phage-type endonuclease
MTNYVITREDQEEYVKALHVTEEERAQIASFPQGSEDWKKKRLGRLSGSMIGAVVGHNFFRPHAKLLKELLWEPFDGNEATEYGNNNEKKAASIYTNYQKSRCEDFHVMFPGFFIHESMPWFGYSPDGLIWENGIPGLLEIKCPFKKEFYKVISPFYFDQVQLGMFISKRSYCDFVVFTPQQTSIERFVFNEPYVTNFLIPRSNDFYFRKYLPLLIAKEKGWLAHGECSLPAHIKVEYYRPANIESAIGPI